MSRLYREVFGLVLVLMNFNVNIRGSVALCLTNASSDGIPDSNKQVSFGVFFLTSSKRLTADMYNFSTGAKDTSNQVSQPYKIADENAASKTFRFTKNGAS